MFIANVSRREKILFFSTVAAISLGLMYNFVLRPAAGKWSELNRRILDKEVELKRNVKYIGQKNEVKKIYQEGARYVKNEGTDEEEMASFLNEVEELASASGIHITNIRPKPTKKVSFYKKYALEMNCETTMEDYIKFAYGLQKSGQLIRVEKLKLTSQGKDTPLLKTRLFITKALIIQ